MNTSLMQCFVLEDSKSCGSNLDFNESNGGPRKSNSPNEYTLIDVGLILYVYVCCLIE